MLKRPINFFVEGAIEFAVLVGLGVELEVELLEPDDELVDLAAEDDTVLVLVLDAEDDVEEEDLAKQAESHPVELLSDGIGLSSKAN